MVQPAPAALATRPTSTARSTGSSSPARRPASIDGDTAGAGPGESVDVAIGQAHRICNEHDEELVIIEVQRGDYTGEDDIVRLEDDYGRGGAAAR